MIAYKCDWCTSEILLLTMRSEQILDFKGLPSGDPVCKNILHFCDDNCRSEFWQAVNSKVRDKGKEKE